MRDLLRQRLSFEGMVGQRGRPQHGTRPSSSATGRFPRKVGLRARLVPRRSTQREHSQFTDRQHALGRSDRQRGRDSLRDQLRSGHRSDLWPQHQSSEYGPGLRDIEPVGPQELQHALQFAHFVEFPDDPHTSGTLSRAGVRPSLQGRIVTRRSERSGCGARRCPRPAAEDQFRR